MQLPGVLILNPLLRYSQALESALRTALKAYDRKAAC
jgi:hypothetical protein